MGLSNKQRVFIEEYLTCWNATQAALKAGYSEKTAAVIGYENLKKPYISEIIKARINEKTMQADEVLVRLTEQARGIPEECFSKYEMLIGVNFEKLAEHKLLHLIKKISYDRQGNPIIEFYDAQSALVQLGKYHALFTERIQHDNWRSEAIEYIRKGEIGYEALADEIGIDLATELFTAAGVPVASGARSEQNT